MSDFVGFFFKDKLVLAGTHTHSHAESYTHSVHTRHKFVTRMYCRDERRRTNRRTTLFAARMCCARAYALRICVVRRTRSVCAMRVCAHVAPCVRAPRMTRTQRGRLAQTDATLTSWLLPPSSEMADIRGCVCARPITACAVHFLFASIDKGAHRRITAAWPRDSNGCTVQMSTISRMKANANNNKKEREKRQKKR